MADISQKLLMPNSTQIPNVLLDVIMPAVSPGTWKIVSCVARQTYGWQKRWDAISISMIEKKTGLSNRFVIDTMEEMREAGLVLRREGERKEFGYEYCLNIECDMDRAAQLLKPEDRKARIKPSGGRKKGESAGEPGSPLPVNPDHAAHEPIADAAGSPLPMNRVPEAVNPVHTQKHTTYKTNYLNLGEQQPSRSQMALSPNVALIAQTNLLKKIGDFWRIAESESTGDNQARGLFIHVRMSAKHCGLDYEQAKRFLIDHPGWHDWPYLKDLDSQQEIMFPDPPRPQPQSAEEAEITWWQQRLSPERYESAKGKALEYLTTKAAKKSVDQVWRELCSCLGTVNTNAIDEFVDSIQQLGATA